MIDSIMVIPLLIGVLYLLFFVYRKVRIDLFRDKVFKIRRSLFLIAADNPDEFFKDNSFYRFFESVLNASLSYTEEFSLIHSFLDTNIRFDYAKRNKIESFDFDYVKKTYLKKIKSSETREKVSKLLNDFESQYGLFLMTRTFLETILWISTAVIIFLFLAIKALVEQQKKDLRNMALAYSSRRINKAMSNSQFAFAVSMVGTL
jgi:hypothetical protein